MPSLWSKYQNLAELNEPAERRHSLASDAQCIAREGIVFDFEIQSALDASSEIALFTTALPIQLLQDGQISVPDGTVGAFVLMDFDLGIWESV